MINYFEWPKRKISVTSLRLDTQNPRLTSNGKKPSQSEIIDYLIEHEKVIDLAKDILAQGYFLNEQPIVCREDNKFIVLEGNRRVAACKILINPDLVKSNGRRSLLKKSLKGFDLDIITKLEVIISPSREDADVMIVNRHTGGSVVEKWDKTKQDRFLYNRYIAGESIDDMASKFSMEKSEIKRSFQRHNVFNEIFKLDLDKKTRKVLDEETRFNMTNVERVYDSQYGRKFLGIEFNENGEVIRKLPQAEFNKRLKTIVEKVVDNQINSRTFNTEKQRVTYLKDLIETEGFDTSIKPDTKYNEEPVIPVETTSESEKTPSAKSNRKPVSSTKLFAATLYFDTGNKRIDEIFYEIKCMNLKNHSNGIAVLLRSYIDMLTYQFLKKKEGIADFLKIEGEKLKSENEKRMQSMKDYLINDLGIKELKIDEGKLQKALKLKGSIKNGFIPSLRFMLDYLVKSDLIEEAKLKSSLSSYLSKDGKIDKIIGHNEFNLLVHNEYYTNDEDDLKSAWNKLEPILEYMVNEIKKP